MGNSIVRGVKRETEARAVLVGLDFSGKTKILYWLKNQSPTELELCLGPTKGFNVETIQGNTKITIWDIGGNVNERCHWRHFYPNIDAVIFVIDANDPVRFMEAVEELKSVVDSPDLHESIPILMYINKVDCPNSMQVEEITSQLPSLKTHTNYVQACSAQTGEGLKEGLVWLETTINNK